jgi:hypothetical protein
MYTHKIIQEQVLGDWEAIEENPKYTKSTSRYSKKESYLNEKLTN